MRLFLVCVLMVCMMGGVVAQDFFGPKGTWGIDREKQVIVVSDPGHREVTTMRFEGETYTVYRTDFPIITVHTDGPIVNTPAVHGTISVADTDGSVIEMHAGFKIRGTSSQQYDKKSYRVELWSDESGSTMLDTAFLGLRSDDDWNLEAMWAQPLRLRDKVANELWMEFYHLPYQANEPEALPGVRMRYADLFVNDSYRGVYALSERMDRKQLGLRKYNGSIRGLLFKGNGQGAPTFEALPDYDNTLDTWDQYEWVYPNESDTVIDWSTLYNFTNFVMNSSNIAFYSQYSTIFDAANAIDYYLFINVLKGMDNMGRNLFLARYKKSGAFFYAPWDLDAIWGLDTDGQPTYDATGFVGNGFYDRLLDDCSENGFSNTARNRYNTLRTTVLTHEHIMEMIQNQYEELLNEGVYDREHEAWPDFVLDEHQLDYMSDWIEQRLAYLDEEINAHCGTWNTDDFTDTQDVTVFPNPAIEQINIHLSGFGSQEVSIQLYDCTGRMVYSALVTDGTVRIPTQGLSAGIYTVLVNGDERQKVSRVVVRP